MRTKRAFKVKQNAFFIIFKGLSVIKDSLRPLRPFSYQRSLLVPMKTPKIFWSLRGNQKRTLGRKGLTLPQDVKKWEVFWRFQVVQNGKIIFKWFNSKFDRRLWILYHRKRRHVQSEQQNQCTFQKLLKVRNKDIKIPSRNIFL